MLKSLIFTSLISFGPAAFAQVICSPAATPQKPTQLSCGIERTAAFVPSTQKVSSVTVLISDSARGMARQVDIHKVNQPLAKLDEKNLEKIPAIKAELKKAQKNWATTKLQIEVVSYEFAPKADFFSDSLHKNAISSTKLVRSQPRAVASDRQPHAGGVRHK